MNIYVATQGEYDDYHVVGVFSSYQEAAKYGDVFVTCLDDPGEFAGTFRCDIANAPCIADTCAPAYIYPVSTCFAAGDLIYEGWMRGVPAELGAVNGHGTVTTIHAETKEAAYEIARLLFGTAFNTNLWDSVAQNKERWNPQERPT